MANTNIAIDSELVRDLVAKSILDAISEDQRALIIQQAVQTLLEVPKSSYGTQGISPLQEAFNTAVKKIAYDVVKDYLNTDEINTIINKELRAALDDIFTDRTYLAESIGYSIGENFGDILKKGFNIT